MKWLWTVFGGVLTIGMAACVTDDAAASQRRVGSVLDAGGDAPLAEAGTVDAGQPCTRTKPDSVCCNEWEGPAEVAAFSMRLTGNADYSGARVWNKPNALPGEEWVLFAQGTGLAQTTVSAVKISDPSAVAIPVVLSIDPATAIFGWPAPFPDSTYLVATSQTEGALKIFSWNTTEQKFAAAGVPAIPREMQTGDGQIVKAAGGEIVAVYSQLTTDPLPSKKIRLGTYVAGENLFRAGTRNEVADIPGALNQWAPFMLASGLVLYFAATAEADSPQDAKIYKATRTNSAQPFSDISILGDLNVATASSLPTWVSEDECRILFTSNREGNYRIYERRHRRPGN